MLAQNFKTAVDLRITEIEKESLIKVMGLLERGELLIYNGKAIEGIKNYMYMPEVRRERDCGTVACICGWANSISNGEAFPAITEMPSALFLQSSCRENPELGDLFAVSRRTERLVPVLGIATSEQIASGIRNYLTVGKPNWGTILGKGEQYDF